jgi:hypothetical protein
MIKRPTSSLYKRGKVWEEGEEVLLLHTVFLPPAGIGDPNTRNIMALAWPVQ